MSNKDNFVSRFHVPLPNEVCKIKAMIYENDEPVVQICEWKPFNPEEYPKDKMPAEGYLGTAKIIEGVFAGIGYHAWRQNNSEFVYYCRIEEE